MTWDYTLPLAVIIALGVVVAATGFIALLVLAFVYFCRENYYDKNARYPYWTRRTKPIAAIIYWFTLIAVIIFSLGYIPS